MDTLRLPPAPPAEQQQAQPPAAPSWQTENDTADREAFREAVVELLKQRKPGATDDWVGRLPLMAVKLEGILYNTAKTREEYLDRSSLKQRLQQVAASREASKQQEGGGGRSSGAPPTAPPHPDTMLSLASARAAEEENQKRQQVLRHQQQRLIFLRHAYKCPYEHGKCPRTPHCSVFKTLWQHILKCADKNCKTAHCVSSRYLLKHYTDCKELRCPICGPVRLAIQRNPGEGGGGVGAIGRGVGGGVILGGAAPKLQVKFPLDAVSCPLYCFSSEQIANHYKTIHEGARLTVNKIREICLPVLEDVLKQRWAYQIFGSPVDPVALKLPDYFDIVKVPMDLGTVRKRLDMGVYRSLDHFRGDVMQTFANALMYNPITTDVYSIALDYKQKFEDKYTRMLINIEEDLKRKRKDPENCGVCGEHKVNFNLDVYWCYGQCGSRIKKNAWYFRNTQHSIYLCKPCFDIQRDPIRTAEAVVTKASFGPKLKHDKEEEEPWVQCGICDKWVHMICCLFNNRRNFGDDTAFVCAPCLENMRRRKGSLDGIVAPLTKKIAASDLPHTTLSLFLENRINECLQRAYQDASEKQGVPVEEVERCPRVSLRQVSSIDKNQQVKEGVLNRYKHKNYPTEFPFRTKCLVLFQNIDGQDVILFGMYVYEYGHKAPAPNQRRVYISYLDSVYFFRPRQYRTLVYHEVIISYLEYVKLRGFHTAHIWACPPLKGDDYILYCHPTDQKTPRDDQLRKWYQDLLDVCKARGIVTEISDIYQEFLKDPTNDATVLPYLDGDYWTNEAEEIIKDLAKGKIQLPDPIAAEIAEIQAVAALEGGGGEDSSSSDPLGKRGGANKSKAKAAAIAASVGSSRPARSAKAGMPIRPNERDPVMAKLASILEPMKEAFFVARLRPKEYAMEKEEQRRLELIEEARQDTEAEVAKKKQALQEEALQGQGMGSEVVLPPAQAQAKPDQDKEEKEDDEDFCKAVGSINSEKQLESAGSMTNLSSFDTQGSSQTSQADASAGGEGCGGVGMDVAGENEVKADEPSDSAPRASTARDDSGLGVKRKFDQVQAEVKEETKVEDKAAAGDQVVITGAGVGGGKQLSFSGPGPSQPTPNPAATDDKKTADRESDISKILDERGIPRCFANMKDDTEDVDETQDSEHFDARTSFLTLCQGNHYQFDQLRRAKHSSMMVLYHLHNPDAPKFTPNCSNCRVEINAGYRHHCSACDVNFCTPCLRYHGPNLHQHALRAVDMSGSAPTQLTEEQKRERERSIQMHMALLVHASSCVAPSCPSKSCQKLKDFIKHFNTCPTKAVRGCMACRKVGNLLQLHARTCKEDVCAVPRCLEIRDQLRQAAQRQQNMDDSRRRMMNNMYGRPSAGPEEKQGGAQDEE